MAFTRLKLNSPLRGRSLTPRRKNGSTDLWANSGCFCVKAITDQDTTFFNTVLKEAKKCATSYGAKSFVKCANANGLTECDTSVFSACPGTLPTNGFVGKTQAQIKAEVEARPAKKPPAPPPVSIPPTATAKKVQLDLRLKDATGFLGDTTAAKNKRKELEENLAKALCNCASPYLQGEDRFRLEGLHHREGGGREGGRLARFSRTD